MKNTIFRDILNINKETVAIIKDEVLPGVGAEIDSKLNEIDKGHTEEDLTIATLKGDTLLSLFCKNGLYNILVNGLNNNETIATHYCREPLFEIKDNENMIEVELQIFTLYTEVSIELTFVKNKKSLLGYLFEIEVDT
ncbi:hypothetical protein RGQ13_00580 [Thalassotalea psychrophila]|uniref:Uncharacterized protein n=1 Tax=Thalassotalea psychrophila TaxID=3065647 RepID=A0ABY9TVH9_9GAMM|nr:hypothetical protein RGQ13_00580 [Colwelliaceae bacterium SQ149]